MTYMSETIQASMAKVMQAVREVAKNDSNTGLNFKFRGIDAVVNAVAPALRANNVIVMPHLEEHTFTQMTTGNGKSALHVILKVRYRFTGIQGDFLDAVVMGEAIDYGDKAVSKAMSVAFRIALLQALALPTDEVDPDAQNYERGSTRDAYKQTAAQPVQVAKESDPWAIAEKPQADHVSNAVELIQENMGGVEQKTPPNCSCGVPMKWTDGISKKDGKTPWGKLSCGDWNKNRGAGCSDIQWFVVSATTGQWRPQ
jgi:hypothetical protein